VRAAGCRHPSSLRSPEASAAWLKEGPRRSGKNTAARAMGASRVFQPFPHRHCKIAWPGKKWACLRRRPSKRSFLASRARSLRPERLTIALYFSPDASWCALELGARFCALKSTAPRVKNAALLTLGEGAGTGGLGAALRSLVSPKRCTTTCCVVCLTCTLLSGQETPPIN